MVFTHATRVRVPDGESFLLIYFWTKKKVILRRPGIKPGSRPWQGRILSLYYRRGRVSLSIPRLELGTSRVLGERHDQLDHTDESRESRLEYLGFDPSTSSLLRTHASDCANTPVASLVEYLGFDPSTSCLRSTHASDCANTPKVHSVTGNRTPGICVTGRDVTNYTMTDERRLAARAQAARFGRAGAWSCGDSLVVRSYQGEHSASHPNCELKHP